MKKLMVIACVMAMVCLAVSASAYTIQGGPTANSGGAFMITTASVTVAPVNDTATVQTWMALSVDQAWAGVGDPGALNQRLGITTNPPALWTFAAYVESAVQNPTLTIAIYGATNQLADVVGKTWELRNKETGVLLDSVVWTAAMTTAAASGFSYTFANTEGMVGRANAVALTLGEAATIITPEPGSMVAMFSGLVGLVGFGIRRRK